MARIEDWPGGVTVSGIAPPAAETGIVSVEVGVCAPVGADIIARFPQLPALLSQVM
jgi:hypothetical protein